MPNPSRPFHPTKAAGGVKAEGPIRKQSLEERQRYMREYMRDYRRDHPGLSTPYVRRFRARRRKLAKHDRT
jgi:hypothetical protein